MEENPVVAAIVFALLAGGVAFAVFTLLPDTYRAARIPVAAVAALMGAINGWDKFGGNEPTAAEVEQQLLESEELGDLAAAFERADPLAFAAYVEQVRAATVGEEDQDAAKIQAALTIQAAAEARLGARPFEDIVAYYHLQRDELLEMRSVSPALCRPLFFGTPDARPIELSSALRQRRLDMMLRAFGPTSETPPLPLSEAEMSTAMSDVFARTAEVVGPDADLLDLDTDATGREARSCEVLAEVVNQISQSPDVARIFVTARQQQSRPT